MSSQEEVERGDGQERGILLLRGGEMRKMLRLRVKWEGKKTEDRIDLNPGRSKNNQIRGMRLR